MINPFQCNIKGNMCLCKDLFTNIRTAIWPKTESRRVSGAGILKGYEETFESDRYLHYIDCADGFIDV